MALENQENISIKHKFIVKELSFINKQKTGNGFKVIPEFSKSVTILSDHQFDVSIRCEIKDSENNPFPFNIVAVLSLISDFTNGVNMSKEELDHYLNFTCLHLLFPYIRATITSLTGAALVTPLVLPVIDVNSFIKSLSNDKVANI